VPFLLSFLGHNEIVVGAALSLFSGMGDLMLPTALVSLISAQVVGEPRYLRVVRYTVLPTIVTALWAIGMILLANPISRLIPG
jgi:presenilin-like A22 family membrane protease